MHPNGTPRRARWSSIVLAGVLAACAFAARPSVLGAQQAPPPAQLDSIKQRLDDAEAALQALREQLATEASTALRTRSRVALEFTGRALMHVLWNDGVTNNVDVPTFARDASAVPAGGMAMTIRQTTLGLAFTATEIAGGTFRGDIDADFYGGQQPSSGGRTFPLLRLRTARGTIDWAKGSLMIGQEQPLITGVDPVSLASVGVPGFTAAGNLWLWLPQIRGGIHTGGPVRFGLEGAVLAPTSGDPVDPFDTQFDPAERTRKPYLQAQVRMDWGEEERRGAVTLGMHIGTLFNPAGAEVSSEAIAATVRLPIGKRLELRGEAFDGQALRGLGGGGIAQGISPNGDPVRTRGGWGQLNLQATPRLLVGAGAGMDDPEDGDLTGFGRTKNTTTEVHAHWRPAGPLVFGLEWRQSRTDWKVIGMQSNNHLNFALGFEF